MSVVAAEGDSRWPELDRPARATARSGEPLDAVVIGAGLAGLTAAGLLAGQGRSVIVVEARDRVGGRTLSHRVGSDTIDLGAQWIGPRHRRIHELARELGVRTCRQWTGGRKVLEIHGRVKRYSGLVPPISLLALLEIPLALRSLERMRSSVVAAEPWRAERARSWDAMTVETWKNRALMSRSARALIDLSVRALACAEPAELSLLQLLFAASSATGFVHQLEVDGGTLQDRFVGGAQQLSLGLASRLEGSVLLRSPVRSIEQANDLVVVRSDRAVHEARTCIVALPPALAGRIVYEPALPAARDRLTQRMAMGSVIKFVVCYPRPFWRDVRLSGEVLSDRAPFSVLFDDSPEDGSQGALVGLIVAGAARAWGSRSEQDRRTAILEALGRIFGVAANAPTGYVEKDWGADTHSRGGYSGLFPPGALVDCGPALREPCGRIHWAGSETAVEFFGYMEGAVESGERVAAEVLARLGAAAPRGRDPANHRGDRPLTSGDGTSKGDVFQQGGESAPDGVQSRTGRGGRVVSGAIRRARRRGMGAWSDDRRRGASPRARRGSRGPS